MGKLVFLLGALFFSPEGALGKEKDLLRSREGNPSGNVKGPLSPAKHLLPLLPAFISFLCFPS